MPSSHLILCRPLLLLLPPIPPSIRVFSNEKSLETYEGKKDSKSEMKEEVIRSTQQKQNGSSVQFSRVQLFGTSWTAARQASLSITNFQSLPKLSSIESVMPSNHLILCRPLLLPPQSFPASGSFSNESALHIRQPKYWSFSFSISRSNEYSGLISLRID